MFEILGLLSDDECDYLVNLVNMNGFVESVIVCREMVIREGVNIMLI